MKSIVKKIDITISPLCQRAKLLTFYKFWRFCQELKITKSPSERKGELLKEPDFLKREGEGGRNAVPCRLGEIISQIRLSAPAERNEKRFNFSQITDGVRNLFAVKQKRERVAYFHLRDADARHRFSVFLNPVSVGKADAVKIPVADDPCSRQRPSATGILTAS